MLGHSHSLSGAVTGAATGILLHMSDPRIAALAVFTAGAALLPDLDAVHSCCARSLGFLSGAVSHVIRFVSGGHRHTTHSVLGIAVFTAAAVAACFFRHDPGGMAGLAFLVCLIVSAALEALHLTRSHAADAIGAAAAGAVVGLGWGLELIPLAVLVGCATHIAGDMLTDSGCMLGYPAFDHRFHLLPGPLQLTTGEWPENRVVVPILTVALAGLAFWTAFPVEAHHAVIVTLARI